MMNLLASPPLLTMVHDIVSRPHTYALSRPRRHKTTPKHRMLRSRRHHEFCLAETKFPSITTTLLSRFETRHVLCEQAMSAYGTGSREIRSYENPNFTSVVRQKPAAACPVSMFTTIDPRASLGIDNIAELLHGTRPSSAPHCVMDTKHQKSGPEADQTKTKKLCPLGLMQPCERRPRRDFALLSGTPHEDPRLSA